ncbi:DUF6300 family protein [Microbispora bryophytorum]|uniref:DUF6300 family protein n=1 Tax=Microbispora bryophytorum TaxID=1460882 RepID=UPI0033C61702
MRRRHQSSPGRERTRCVIKATPPQTRAESKSSLTAEPPECGRCGQAGILSARVPHHFVNARNETVRGAVVLRPRCDIGQPEAGALIAWFTDLKR